VPDAPGEDLMNAVSDPEPSSPEAARRRFLKGGVALGTALASGAVRSAAGKPASEDPSRVLGGPLRPYGERSRFEETVREKWPPSKTDEFGSAPTPLDDTLGIITPAALHYVVQRGGLPDIDPRKHRLLIHGMVDRPVILTMEEIRRLPSASRILFLAPLPRPSPSGRSGASGNTPPRSGATSAGRSPSTSPAPSRPTRSMRSPPTSST
jgi:molybdopterin-dependent oxidoreductase-like protein protein